ncbi:MAG: flagellar hook-basal body complex protein FliE [Promethearchaeota archaeon]|nr:MAG: flagellar hook-basal body complex protein FliE [Candidatus Lokiarchaeota archaeon]
MTAKIVLGFVSLPGAGKSTALKAVDDLGPIVTMGDIIREETKKRGLPLTDKNLGFVASDLRKKEGKGIIAKLCMTRIKQKKSNVVFVDGLRSLKEVELFQQYWTFPVIAIKISQEKRFEIIKKRNRDDDPTTLEELKQRDKREINFGLQKVIDNADYVIYNDSTEEKLKKKTRQKVFEIIKNYSK